MSQFTEAPEPEVGVPGYSHLVRIGRGGHSVVYRAVHDRLSREVALKVIFTDFGDPGFARAFENECRVLGMLSTHRHVVDVYDAGVTADGRGFIAMHLYPNGTIADRVRTLGPIPVPEAVGITAKLASALQCSHDFGVIHRDVKPENVLIDEFGEPVLTDFGVAAVADADGRYTTSVAFTRSHAAPEVLDSNAYGPASDQYSLASTLYALIAGSPAFHAETESRQILAVLHDEVPPLSAPGVTPALTETINRGMAKDPQLRFTTVAAFGDALLVAVPTSGLTIDDATRIRLTRATATVDHLDWEGRTGSAREIDLTRVRRPVSSQAPEPDETHQFVAGSATSEPPQQGVLAQASTTERPDPTSVAGATNLAKRRTAAALIGGAVIVLAGTGLVSSRIIASGDAAPGPLPGGVSASPASSASPSPAQDPTSAPAPSDPKPRSAEVVETIKVDPDPGHAVLSPDGKSLYVTSRATDRISVISTKTGKVKRRIDVGARPNSLSVGPAGAALYVATAGGGTVRVINPESGAHSDIRIGGRVSSASPTPDGKYLWVALSETDSIAKVDLSSRSVAKRLRVGDGPTSVRVTPDGKYAMSANRLDDTISVIDTKRNRVVKTIKVGDSPRGARGTKDGLWSFTPNYEDSTLSMIRMNDLKVAKTAKVGRGPRATDISPDGRTVLVADYDADSVSVFDVGSRKVTQKVDVDSRPVSIAFAADGESAYVANEGSGTVSVLEFR